MWHAMHPLVGSTGQTELFFRGVGFLEGSEGESEIAAGWPSATSSPKGLAREF